MHNNPILLMLGSNIATAHLSRAIELLRERCDVLALSPVYQTIAQGNNGPDYLNMAVKISTSLSPERYKLDVLRAIEVEMGRRRGSPDVLIDLDIAIWGDSAFEYGAKPWYSPTADITRYAFVARPLTDLAPEYIHPVTGQTLAQIADALGDEGIQKLGELHLL
jgi:2-amino-4-hydroxy-6-hydroxymethyldihydropteridine diphosphokinase